ncbi:4-hydroxybenzoate polyprenyltransferase, mitochondrial-like isoform X2 [Silene latifolia]|uniref:4-hydroxybenzoate polyprenyltransferase, mitochondrial-like isoform X2 n=1 Tax=Silene latifolia TaxID=37657 RepID=UPI003D788F31
MSILCRLSRSRCHRLASLSVSNLSFHHHHHSHPNPNPCPCPKPIFDHNSTPSLNYFSLRQPHVVRFGQNALFSTSSGVVQGSNHASGGKDDGNDRKLRKESGKTWVDLYLPQGIQPYAKLARLDKPIGTWLLAWPCMWSITMAAEPGSLPDFKMLALFGCGSFLLRGAGCTINDLLDQDIDVKVERTKLRPIASGLLTPFQGVSFLGLQLLLGLGILLQLNNYSVMLGASSLLLVFSYPLMKRWTFWDKDDDLKVGVKSTALRFGESTKEWLSGFGVACSAGLALSGYNADLGWPYYICLTAASGQLAWQIYTVDLSKRADCNRMFVSNKWFGALVFSGILLGRLAT